MQKNPDKTDFRVEEVIQRKGDELYQNGKTMIISLTAGLMKKMFHSEYIKISIFLSRMSVLIVISVSNWIYQIMQQKRIWEKLQVLIRLPAKSDLASLKAEVDKIDVDKLKTAPVHVSKLSNVVKNNVKKTVCDKLVVKENAIDISGFVLKTQYDTDKSGLQKKISSADKKIPDTSGLVKN